MALLRYINSNGEVNDLGHPLNLIVGETIEAPSVPMDIPNIIDISTYGAKFNDETFDNKPILHKAMDDLVAMGGGTIYVPDKGDLYISENLKVKPNITLLGANSRPALKIMPSIQNFWSIVHLDFSQNVKLINLTIDSNRDERERQGNLGDLLGNFPQIVISMSNESQNITIENCHIKGNGTWLLSVFASADKPHAGNLKIRDNLFEWKMGYATPDKPFTDGVTIDNTMIYFDAIDYALENNKVKIHTPSANMTAIEAHGARGVVRNNEVVGARTGIIPWSLVNNFHGDIRNNLVVENNRFIDVLNGFDIGMTPGHNLRGVTIANNYIKLNPNNFPNPIASRGVIVGAWNGVEEGQLTEDVKIIGNVIESVDYDIQHNDPYIYYNFFGIGVISGEHHNLQISDNTVKNVPSFGLLINNEFQKTIKLFNSLINGNILQDAAKSQTSRGSLNISALRINDKPDINISSLVMRNNTIFDTKDTGSYYTPNYPYIIPSNGLLEKPII